MLKKIEQLSALRWFDSFGNTYHSVKIWYDDNTSDVVPFSYGYDNQFIETAANHCRVNHNPAVTMRTVLNDPSIIISVRDVKRKKDLDKF